jgi:L-threonylcarbamoyladenylate synthase
MAFADGAAAIVVTEAARAAAAGCRPVQVLPDDPAGYARELYAALHAVDRAGAASVVIEAPPPDDPAWWAVRDRLSRAARR